MSRSFGTRCGVRMRYRSVRRWLDAGAKARSGTRWRRRRFLVSGHRLIDLVLDPRYAFLEFDDALAQRTHHARQAVAEEEEAHSRQDHHLPRAEIGEEERIRHHLQAPP